MAIQLNQNKKGVEIVTSKVVMMIFAAIVLIVLVFVILYIKSHLDGTGSGVDTAFSKLS